MTYSVDFRKKVLAIKKTLNHPKADQEKRSMFCQRIEKLQDEGRTIAYIDESGFAQDMPRTHGYSAKGERCFGTHDWGPKDEQTLLAQ